MTPAALLFATLASVSQPCVTAETALHGAAYYGVQVEAHMTGDSARIFIDAFNALPPVSEIVAEEVIVVAVPRRPAVEIVFFHDGCALPVQSFLHIEVFDRIVPSV